jgi:hypothetical protein
MSSITRAAFKRTLLLWKARKLGILILAGIVGVGYGCGIRTSGNEVFDPLVPTLIGSPQVLTSVPVGMAVEELEEVSPASKDAWRFGFCISTLADPDLWGRGLGATWYLDWDVVERHPDEGIEHWQMVRVSEDGFTPDVKTVEGLAGNYSGSTWVIGNEPDVIWQDDTTPETYAQHYHDLYGVIKRTDPTSRIAMAGVSQGTPLRLAYLDRVLEAYEDAYGEPMPVDVWTLHGFVLREERGSWGVEIPPGFDDDSGMLYEVSDHGRLDIFETHIRDFRRWMRTRGYRECPLALTEFGILMPHDYGYPPEVVEKYMQSVFDLLLSMQDVDTGLPSDGNRLVQQWAWFSLDSETFPTGNLADVRTSHLTPLGWAYRTYMQSLGESER